MCNHPVRCHAMSYKLTSQYMHAHSNPNKSCMQCTVHTYMHVQQSYSMPIMQCDTDFSCMQLQQYAALPLVQLVINIFSFTTHALIILK